ncbi:MAG: hypothetical protein ABI550_04590 [Ignavibacteriaceae bacterium]
MRQQKFFINKYYQIVDDFGDEFKDPIAVSPNQLIYFIKHPEIFEENIFIVANNSALFKINQVNQDSLMIRASKKYVGIYINENALEDFDYELKIYNCEEFKERKATKMKVVVN